MLGQHPTHANFSVDDLATAKKFYVDKLGFNAEKQDEFAVLLKSDAGTRVLVYHKPDHQAWDSTVLGIEVDDVKAVVSELRASGISIEKLDGTDDDGIMTIPDMGEAALVQGPCRELDLRKSHDLTSISPVWRRCRRASPVTTA